MQPIYTCLRCDYPLDDIEQGRCPECGWEIDRSKIHRARLDRLPRVMMTIQAGVLLCVLHSIASIVVRLEDILTQWEAGLGLTQDQVLGAVVSPAISVSLLLLWMSQRERLLLAGLWARVIALLVVVTWLITSLRFGAIP